MVHARNKILFFQRERSLQVTGFEIKPKKNISAAYILLPISDLRM